jgi:hypothetical protein
VDVLPWAGLGIFLVALVAGVTVAAVQGLRTWQTFSAFESKLGAAMAETTLLLDGIEPRVARASAGAVRLEQARASLEQSMAVAAVLFSALDEARELLRRVTSFVPR